MKPSMLAKLDQLANRLVELDELLMSEGATANMDSYRKMTREHAELSPLVALYKQYGAAQDDIAAAQEMAQDPEMKDFAQEEIEDAKSRLAPIACSNGHAGRVSVQCSRPTSTIGARAPGSA